LPVLWQLIYGDANPEWKKWDAPYFPLTPLSFEDYVTKMKQKLSNQEWPPDQCVIEVEGQVIGQMTYYWESKDTRWLEMGIVIYLPAYWNGGYGTEALAFWTDFLLRELPIARVGLTTWSGNERMIRVAEKLGMQMEGRMRKCRYYNGVYYDSIRMGILREEWDLVKTQFGFSHHTS
jgi:RimJ/RimL family protein N-acetyltransferase